MDSRDTAIFRVPRPERSHPFLPAHTEKFLNQLLTFMNFYRHANNQTISSFCSRDIVDLKILQSDSPRTFWPISQKPNFPWIWDLCQAIANNFIIEQIQITLMTKYFSKFQKKYFWSASWEKFF